MSNKRSSSSESEGDHLPRGSLAKRRRIEIAPLDLSHLEEIEPVGEIIKVDELLETPVRGPLDPKVPKEEEEDSEEEDTDPEEEIVIDETLKKDCPCHKNEVCKGYAFCECDCDYCEAVILKTRIAIDMEIEEEDFALAEAEREAAEVLSSSSSPTGS